MTFYEELLSTRDHFDAEQRAVRKTRMIMGKHAALYVDIKWQDGPYRGDEGEHNGACVEEVLIDAYEHLYYLNKKFPCKENEMALSKIEEAVIWLDARTADRAYRGVLGKEEA